MVLLRIYHPYYCSINIHLIHKNIAHKYFKLYTLKICSYLVNQLPLINLLIESNNIVNPVDIRAPIEFTLNFL